MLRELRLLRLLRSTPERGQHSLMEDDRVEVLTNINGQQWPVSIPCGTTLDHVRIELLNMGAEYVWLDVLCLRQKGADADEPTRKEEWKIDVPTLGYVYRGSPWSRPCIIYFNGLGLPLDTSPQLLESDRHWFNRVWTLQESLKEWLPGGLTGGPLPSSLDFFSRLHGLVFSMSTAARPELVQELTRRHCTKELDKVSGLAYLLECPTLPLYDESLSVESAWTLLLKHMSEMALISTFLEYAVDTPFGLCISWSGFLHAQPISVLPSLPWRVLYYLLNSRGLQVTDQERFASGERIIVGPCTVQGPHGDVVDRIQFVGPLDITVRLDTERDSISFRPAGIHGIFLRDISYFLVSVGTMREWVAIEVAEERGGEEPEVDVIKWGVFGVSGDDGKAIECLSAGRKRATVTYLGGEEALRRSVHTERYMEAFTEMQARGETLSFGE